MTNNNITQRYFAIDNLKIALMFVVMFGHTLLPYTTTPRAFKDPSVHIGFDIAGIFLVSFAMQAFFLTAGYAAAQALAKKGLKAFWQNRLVRIFIPFLAAYTLLSPVMKAIYDFAISTSSSGSIQQGLEALTSMQWLRWGKAYHLWFLLSLLIFTAVTVLTLAIGRRLLSANSIGKWLSHWCSGIRGIGILIFTFSILTLPAYIIKGVGLHWSMQITLLGYFMLGWAVFRYPVLLTSWLPYRHLLLILSVVTLPMCIWASRIRLFEENTLDLAVGSIAGITNGIVGFCMTLSLLCYFHLHLNFRSKQGDVLSAGSYWVYLAHYPIVVAVAGLISVLALPALVKYVLTVTITISVLSVSYKLFVGLTKTKQNSTKTWLNNKVGST